jgi:hypothetical protein
MARPDIPRIPTQVAVFVRDELNELVDDLYTHGKVKTTNQDVVGALVVAARQLPVEVVVALLAAYVGRENAEAAKLSAPPTDE